MTPALIETVSSLSDTLARENAALDALDLAAAVAVLPDKRRALALLTDAAPMVLSAEQRPAMEAALRRLRELAGENRVLLQRALTVQSRVIDIVAGSLPRAQPGGRYSATGARVVPPRAMAWSMSTRV
jgi:hypothetical protein